MRLEFRKKGRWILKTNWCIVQWLHVIDDPHTYLVMLLEHGAAKTNKIYNIQRK